MKPIKIIQVTTPRFQYKGVDYYANSIRYMNFHQFQDAIDRKIRMGATHLFIYNTMNAYEDGKAISDYSNIEGEEIADIWIRHKFLTLENDE